MWVSFTIKRHQRWWFEVLWDLIISDCLRQRLGI